LANERPWKLAAVAMALVIVTVVATGLVVANWRDKRMVDVSPGRATPTVATPSAVPAAPTTAGVPTQSAVDACNQSAAAQAGQRENTKDTVIAGAIGAGGGTLYGLNENKKHDESYRNAYAACMHSRGYTG
jgi:hypothetical protein